MSQTKTNKAEKPNPVMTFSKAIGQWFIGRLKIFCTNTMTHEFSFFVDKSFSLSEKIAWFIAVLLCFATAASLLWYSLFLSSDTPTVTVVESTHYPTYKIPFPGVTVCNVNKFSKKAIMALAKEL